VIDCVEFNAECAQSMGAPISPSGVGCSQRQADLIAPCWRATAERSSPPFIALFCAHRALLRAKVAGGDGGKSPRPAQPWPCPTPL